MKRTEILGVGGYVPPRVVTNQDLEKLMDTSDEWIQQRSGIKERRWVGPEQATTDLAVEAANRALDQAGLTKDAIDLIIFATLSPDHEFPGAGCFFQAKMGLPGIPALDIRQQCSGFIYGLSIADQFVRTGMYNKVMVIGAELQSRGLDCTTRGRDVAVLFGDGAGAMIVGAKEVENAAKDSFIYSTHLHADGTGAKDLWTAAPGTAMGPDERLTVAMLEEGLHWPQMNGKKVFVTAVKKMTEVLVEGLKANQLVPDRVDLFLFHQANARINKTIAEMLKIPPGKIHNTIHKFGNTTAATLPLGMDDAIKAGKLKKGMTVAMSAFGSGFTWASALMRY